MKKDTLEHLSSLMDGEISGETSLFVARRMGSDGELSATWERYHLIRECIRNPGENRASPEFNFDLDQLPDNPLDERQDSRAARWLKPVSGFAIAASVAVVAVMVTVGGGTPGQAPESAAAQPFTSPEPLISVRASQPASFNASTNGQQRLNDLLLRHNQAASKVGGQGFITLVPIVTTVPVQPVEGEGGDPVLSGTEAGSAETTQQN